MNETPVRHGVVPVTKELLAEALGLPEGSQILSAYPDDSRGVINLVVAHPSLPATHPATNLPIVNVIQQRQTVTAHYEISEGDQK